MPKQNWLLVFDNYDDPKKFVNPTIKEFFPQTSHGSILITTRVRSVGKHKNDS
jgi:hypothetical protein